MIDDEITEISQLKKIIAEQNEKIAHLENIIAVLPCNVYWKNKQGYYLGSSKRNLQIVRTSAEHFVGKNIYELLPQPYANDLNKIDEEIMSSGQEKILEEHWIDINGQPAIYLTHKIPLFDKDNNVTGLLGVSYDITERKKIEQELKETKELAEQQSKISHIYLNNFVASLPENFYWMDKESRLIGCNENQAKTLGLPRERILGKNHYDVAKMLNWNKQTADDMRQNDLDVMESRKSKKMEEVVWLNGEKRTFLSYKNPMLDDKNELIGIFGVAIDITEHKQMEAELLIAKEQAELANQAKSEFITNMSHDIRTPFSGILGSARLLQKKETDESKKELLHYIIQSSEKLLTLLNEILELTKFTQKNPSSTITFNLRETIDQITGIALAEVNYKNLKLILNIPEDMPIFLVGDKLKFSRILLNLLNNAVKFTSKGYIAVTVKVISQTQHDINLQMLVEDTGIGIPTDKFETIFEYFTRLTPAHEGSYQGSGLGLYIVKHYMVEMGGSISVNSQLGKGSIFICQFPFKIAKSGNLICENTNKQNVSTTKFIANSKKYILLIEDDPIAQKISKIMLQEYFGCIVDIAENGQRALGMVTNYQYDLIILDIGLPDINGFNLVKKIRALSDQYGHIPIFGLTAHTDETSLTYKQDISFDAILTKPLSEEICYRILEKI